MHYVHRKTISFSRIKPRVKHKTIKHMPLKNIKSRVLLLKMPSVLVVIFFYVLLHTFPSAEFSFGQNVEASTQTEDHYNGSRIVSYGRFFNQLCTRSISEPSFVCDYPYRDGSGIFPEHCCAQPVNPTEGNNYY